MMNKFKQTAVLMIFIAALLAAGWVFASADDSYDLSWWTTDGGGGASSGGSYVLDGTIGQADAGVMQGGIYGLSGGFWSGAAGNGRTVYLPLIVK